MANNHLKIEKFKASELAEEFGTPLYVYNAEQIRTAYRKIYSSIQYEPKQLHYAIMCNDRLKILKVLREQGSYLQINSAKEYLIARNAGFPNSKISVTTTNLDKEDMAMFIKNKIQINFDSLEEIEKYGKLLKQIKKRQTNVNNKIGIRIFAHVKATGQYITNKPYKFKARVGIKRDKFDKAKNLARRYGLKIIGVHGYIASNMMDIKPFLKLNKYLIDCAKEFEDIEYINFGAGFGLPPKTTDQGFDWQNYGKCVSELMREASKHFARKVNLKIEPGRSLMGDAGMLLVKVVNIKNMDDWIELGVDCGFGVFARPYIYGWKSGGYHDVVAADKLINKKINFYTICANSVLQSDYLAEDRKLPKVNIGDILAFLRAGAYGATMMSLFPGMRKPGEILIDKEKIMIISKTESLKPAESFRSGGRDSVG